GQFFMKSTGMIRKVDELGRVVIPIELRRSLHIKERDPVEIYINGDQIILKKHTPRLTCQITDQYSTDNLTLADGKIVLSEEGAKILVEEIQKKFHLS